MRSIVKNSGTPFFRVLSPFQTRLRQPSFFAIFLFHLGVFHFVYLFFLSLPFAWDISPLKALGLCRVRWACGMNPISISHGSKTLLSDLHWFWNPRPRGLRASPVRWLCAVFSTLFDFVMWWLDFLFCGLIHTFLQCLSYYYLKNLLQEGFIVKIVSKLPKLDVNITNTLSWNYFYRDWQSWGNKVFTQSCSQNLRQLFFTETNIKVASFDTYWSILLFRDKYSIQTC